jgi:hypothetical protein
MSSLKPIKPTDKKDLTAVEPSVSAKDKLFFGQKKSPALIIGIYLLIVLVGVGTGYLVSGKKSIFLGGKSLTSEQVSESGVKVGDTIGSQDLETFKDITQGILVEGGIDGEGSHHIVRPGGKSQDVYLTSSVIDLESLVGHRVKIWGETFAAQKAGWLMDVGRAEVLELNAPLPED